MFRSILYVFLGACSYGVLSAMVKLAYQAGFQPGEVTGSQNFFGTLLMVIPFLFMRKSVLSLKNGLQLLGVGLTIGFTSVLYYSCLQYLESSVAIVLLFQFTWMGVFMEAIIERKWPSKDKWMVLFLLLIGTFLAAGVIESGIRSFSFLGILLGFLSAFTYALFILFSGKVATAVDAWSRSTIMSIGSLITSFIVFRPEFLWNGALSQGLFLWGALLAFFGVMVPTLLFNLGVPKIGVGLATILGSAELPMAVLLSSLVLGEQVSAIQWIGVVIILFAIALPELKRRRESLNRVGWS